MSKFTSRTVRMEDLKGAEDWVPNLVQSINLSNNDITDLANGKLVIGDNIAGQIYSASFSTLAKYSTGAWTPLSFVYTGPNRPGSVLIGSIDSTKPLETILTATSLQWSYLNNVSPSKISIDYVAGLKPNQTYSITVIVL